MANTKKSTTSKRFRKAAAAPEVAPAEAPKTVLVLRTCGPDMKSHGGFVWPTAGPVEAPDWEPIAECGNGLHGWKWGAGDWSLKNAAAGAKWLVVEVVEADLVDIQGKVKFSRGVVVACFGHWREAMALIRERLARDAAALLDRQIATGEGEIASATGYSGHASATGYSGHASATGYYGHASATGDSSRSSGRETTPARRLLHLRDRRLPVIRDFLLFFGVGMAVVAWTVVAILWFKLSAFVTAWNKYHCRHEIRLDAVEKKLELGFWAPEKAGGQELARERAAAGGER